MAALTAALSVAGGSLVAAAPAQADYGDCWNYNQVVCLTEHRNWGGKVWRQTPPQILAAPDGCRSFVPDGFNDMASAVVNRTTNYQLYVYEHHDCTGMAVWMGPGGSIVLGQSNDELSSIRVVPSS